MVQKNKEKIVVKNYELVIILSSNLAGDSLQEKVSGIENILKDAGASQIESEFWGKKELSYQFKKEKHGNYYCILFQSDDSALGDELNAALRIDEKVLKFQLHRTGDRERKFKGRAVSQAA